MKYTQRYNNRENIISTLRYQESLSTINEINTLLYRFKDNINEEINKDRINFYKKYSNKIFLKRFSIGIFGSISAGKSTFLNYILGIKDFLEVKADITTKFVCFIRHKKGNEKAEVFKVIPKNRKNIYNENEFFNFEKGDKLDEGNVSEIIARRNEELKNREKNDEKLTVKSDYFLIIETNLPIFNDPVLEKFADYFEFLDIPGLDEGDINENIYVKNLLPVIIPNISFSIFLFNSTNIQTIYSTNIIQIIISNAKEIVKNSISRKNYGFLDKTNIDIIAENICEEISLNSLYIVNKIDEDRIESKLKYIEIVKEKLRTIFKDKKYFDIIKVKDNIIGISALHLLYEQHKNESFYYFLSYVLMEYKNSKDKKNTEFKSFLAKKMKEISNSNSTSKNAKDVEKDDSSSDSESEEDENTNEFDKLSEIEKEKINKLIHEIRNISGNFDIKEYFKLGKKFNPKNIKKRTDFIAEDIIKLLHNSMSKTIYEFIKINAFENLEEYLKDISQKKRLYNLSNDLIEKYECISDPIKVLEESENNFCEELIKMKNIKIVNNMLENIEYKKKMFNNLAYLNYLFIGAYSSGKSSTINTTIIGEDILPTDHDECTKIAIILNHIDNLEESSLYKVSFNPCEEEGNNFFYFDYDKEKPIVKGVKQIKNKLKTINKSAKNNCIDFYLIKMPLKLYDLIDDEGKIGDLKYKIQFIDFPGLDTDLIKASETKKILMQLINGFIFTFRSDNGNLSNTSNTDILRDLINDIINRNQFGFSFKSCLFLMVSEDEKQLVKYKSELIKRLNDVQKHISSVDILKNYNSEIKMDDIQIIKFSNFFYKNYTDVKESLKDYKIFNELNKIKNKDGLKEFYETKIKDKIHLSKKYKFPEEAQAEIDDIISIINKKLKYIKSLTEEDKNKYSEKIARYYYYMNNNTKELNFYKNSGFLDFKKNMNTLFETSNNFYQNTLKISLAKHFNVICDYFMKINSAINIDKANLNTSYFNEENKNIELEKIDNIIANGEKEINKKLDECRKNIENKFSGLIHNLNDKRDDFKNKEDALLKKAVEELNETNEEIKEITNNIIAQNKDVKLEILKNSKKQNGIKNRKNDFKGYSYRMYEMKGYIEENAAIKMSQETAFRYTMWVPIINYIPAGLFLISGLIDYFRDHSEEYKKEIKRITDTFNNNINNYKEGYKKQIQKIKENFKIDIMQIFSIFGEDSKRIEMNAENLLRIMNNFEKFLDNLLLYNEVK